MHFPSSLRTAITVLLFVFSISFSFPVAAEDYEFQFADLISSWFEGEAVRGSHKIILSDVDDSNEFKLTIQTTYEGAEPDERTYYGLKPTGYCDKPKIQFIRFENDEADYIFISEWDDDKLGSKEFLYISKNKRFPLSIQYTNNVFYKENHSASNSLQSSFSVTYRRLHDDILNNPNFQQKTSKIQKDDNTPSSAIPETPSQFDQNSDFDAWRVTNYLKNPLSLTDYPLDPDGFYSFMKSKYKVEKNMSLSGSASFRLALENIDLIFGKGCRFYYYFHRDKERWSYELTFPNATQATDFLNKTFIPRLKKQGVNLVAVKPDHSTQVAKYEAQFSGNDIVVEVTNYNSSAELRIKISRVLPALDASVPPLVRQVTINELLTHPFGLENSTLNSSFDDILGEAKRNRYAIDCAYSHNELSTPVFYDDASRCAPIVQFALSMTDKTVENLTSDEYRLYAQKNKLTYQIDFPLSTQHDDKKKYREIVFNSLVECLKREGYSMKKMDKGLFFKFDALSINKAFIGRKGDLTVMVGMGDSTPLYILVEKPLGK